MGFVFNEKDESGIEALKRIAEEMGEGSLIVQEGQEFYMRFRVEDLYKANNLIYTMFNNDELVKDTGITILEIGRSTLDADVSSRLVNLIETAYGLIHQNDHTIPGDMMNT